MTKLIKGNALQGTKQSHCALMRAPLLGFMCPSLLSEWVCCLMSEMQLSYGEKKTATSGLPDVHSPQGC